MVATRRPSPLDALASWAAALRPGGQLLIVAKEGSGDRVIDDSLGSDLRVYWAEFTEYELRTAVGAADFRVDDCTVREAYEDEIPACRVHLAATRRPHTATAPIPVSVTTYNLPSETRGIRSMPGSPATRRRAAP